MKHIQICRELNLDLWGELLYSHKPFRLTKMIYRKRQKRSKIFVLRIDRIRASPKRKVLSNYSLGKVEKTKFAAFYDYSEKQIRHIILSQRHKRGNFSLGLLSYLESQLHIVLWRAQYFRLQLHAKQFIKAGQVFVHGKVVTNPKYHMTPFSFISLRNPPFGWIYHLVRNLYFRLRARHLYISYPTSSIVYLKHPNPKTLFHFFKFRLAYIFNSPRGQ